MKKALSLLLVLVMCLSLCGCGSENNASGEATTPPEATESSAESAVEEVVDARTLIFEAENTKEALKQYGYLITNAETEEEKIEIETYMCDYYLQDLNGFYYYQRPEKAVMHVDSDNRAILVKNKDEVYIVPYSEKELADMALTLEDIPQIENSELYKYHITELKAQVRADSSGKEYSTIKVLFESDYLDDTMDDSHRTISFSCFSGRDPITFVTYGYFADEKDLILETDLAKGWGASRDYYKDENTALDAKIGRDMKEKNWGEPKEKAEPSIGMTKAEVLDGAWGTPDKKNIDEYEWGTEEQWVYDDMGYVYFENGVVSAIQHRP